MTAKPMADRPSLEAEQSFLLTSLADLESEFAAGDIEEEDYRELKADYTVRTARVARQLRGVDSQPEKQQSPRRWGAWVAALVIFGCLAGWLLATSVGERGVNGQITGSIELSPREQVLECQTMGFQGQLVESFGCFDEVLARDAENAEALTYRGWFGVLASGSAQQAGEDDIAAELLATAGINLDRAVAANPVYPDARAFRMVVLERLGRIDEACDDAAALIELQPPAQIVQLTEPVIARLNCAP